MADLLVEILVDNLLLLPFLFPTYLVLEAIEAHAGGALERTLGRAEMDIVAPVDQKRDHTAAGNQEADGFPLPDQIPQHADVFTSIDCLHSVTPSSE